MFEQVFKNIDDVLWKEAGCTTELDYTEQTEIDVSRLLTDVSRLITRLEELGPERLDEINDDELVRFRFKEKSKLFPA